MTKKKNNKAKDVKSANSTKVVVSKKNQKQGMPVESATNELRRLSTILVSIVGIICVFYIVTIIVTKNNESLHYKTSNEISEISYIDILASDILKKEGAYYVLIKDNSDSYISLYEKYVTSYTSTEEHLPVYYVDLNDALNLNYRSEQNDFSIENLKFKGTTLIKVSNHSIESFYEDSASINEHLRSLVIE